MIVVFDGYDVLLTPRMASIGASLMTSAGGTPIVYCAENGIHPDHTSAWFYPRGTGTAGRGRGDDAVRFLNAGCVAGRAGQFKHLLVSIQRELAVTKDDQLSVTRYLFAHPATVSVDTRQTLFFCAFKEGKHAVTGFSPGPDFVPQFSGHRLSLSPAINASSICLLHFNNR